MKRPPKFKEGDKVKVLRASTEAEYDLWGDCWVPEMNKIIGKIVTIDRYANYDNKYQYYKYWIKENEGYNYCYPEFVLQDVTINKQLLFSFMIR